MCGLVCSLCCGIIKNRKKYMREVNLLHDFRTKVSNPFNKFTPTGLRKGKRISVKKIANKINERLRWEVDTMLGGLFAPGIVQFMPKVRKVSCRFLHSLIRKGDRNMRN